MVVTSFMNDPLASHGQQNCEFELKGCCGIPFTYVFVALLCVSEDISLFTEPWMIPR